MQSIAVGQCVEEGMTPAENTEEPTTVTIASAWIELDLIECRQASPDQAAATTKLTYDVRDEARSPVFFHGGLSLGDDRDSSLRFRVLEGFVRIWSRARVALAAGQASTATLTEAEGGL